MHAQIHQQHCLQLVLDYYINMYYFLQKNSCIIDGMCYTAGETSPNDECLICKPVDNELQWSIVNGM